MHGSRLATVDRVVCLAAPGSDGILERLAAALEPRDAALTVRNVGEGLGEGWSDGTTLGITVGGDGTFLTGAEAFAPRSIPFFGVNAGTVGFLARVRPTDLEGVLDEILAGEAAVTDRQRFRIDGPGVAATGINDVTFELPRPEDPIDRKVCQVEAAVDGEYLGRYEGSGLAVSTPTGSTGMALSAGGPVHHPGRNAALQVVPLHTNRLGVRPVVLDVDREIRVAASSPIRVSVDGGRPRLEADAGETFTVTGAEKPARLVAPSDHVPYVASLTAKLGWGGRSPAEEAPEPFPKQDGGPELSELLAARRADRDGVQDARQSLRRVAREAALAAGETAGEYHRRIRCADSASERQRLASEAERKSRQVLTAVVAREFPDHGIRGPDGVRTAGDSVVDAGDGDGPYTWLTGPIDGTENLVRGSPHYGVTIAALDGDSPVAGAVSAPAFGTVFSASREDGAYRLDTGSQRTTSGSGPELDDARDGPTGGDDAELATTGVDRLEDSVLLAAGNPEPGLLASASRRGAQVRRLGSPALQLCFVAAGRADACVSTALRPQDAAAALCVLRVAGGRVTDLAGEEYRLRPDDDDRTTPLLASNRPLLASNGPLHPALLSGVADDA